MTQQFTGVQILRFVAAMLVAVMHITQAISIHITGQGDAHYWAAGTAGVDIFFVISGFVMVITTQHRPAHGAARAAAAWLFIRRRILRIVPLYWFFTFLKLALLLALPALAVKSAIVPAHVAASLFFIPMTNPAGLVWPLLPVGWTLNFEMLFYAVFAIAIGLGTGRIRFCVMVFLVILLAGRLSPGVVSLQFYGQAMVFEFILGACIAQLLIRYGAPKAALGVALAAAGFLFTFGLGWDGRGARLVPWGIGAALIVLGTLWSEPFIAKVPGARPLAFLGDASYSIYLSHAFVLPAGVLAFKKLGVQDPVAILLMVGAMVMAAGSLSYIWLERPMTSIFKRYLVPQVPRYYPHAANTPVK